MSRKTEVVARTRWQVRSSWSPNWSAISEPFDDDREAWAFYHSLDADRAKGWTTAGGVEMPGPRPGYVVELIEYNTGVSGEKVLARSDRDPSEMGRTRRINVAALLEAARGQSGDAGGDEQPRCVECDAPATSYTPGGLPVCEEHRP